MGRATVTQENADLRTQNAFLTSHVLDLATGRPGADVPLQVWATGDGDGSCVARARSNGDGRFEKPLLCRPDAPATTYRLDFEIGESIGRSTGGFLDIISIDVHLADPDVHYHVPLIVAPWGYTTYRGAPPAHAPVASPPDFRVDRNLAPDTPSAKPPPASGDTATGVTTHVIDLARGVGAGGLQIDVSLVDDKGRSTALNSHNTTPEGRTVDWLVAPPDFSPGVYELTFHIGDYYSAVSSWDEPPFFPVARVRFRVDEPLTHHHIPLLIAPWGYSVYRGS